MNPTAVEYVNRLNLAKSPLMELADIIEDFFNEVKSEVARPLSKRETVLDRIARKEKKWNIFRQFTNNQHQSIRPLIINSDAFMNNLKKNLPEKYDDYLSYKTCKVA
jgi:hypothetical protein